MGGDRTIQRRELDFKTSDLNHIYVQLRKRSEKKKNFDGWGVGPYNQITREKRHGGLGGESREAQR